ncbi:septation protein A [Azoarcus olearius]|uniref:Inner membrane-spanning protein YciB n=1 Tax=Azoarcus sp. (strain BH72) TaxID=418699 RepID=YCIB_AZOSB|nr:septation protein A [Azoarcus olearius]A1K668.1 RecName: Full=Inner membrane-spanning protein YciB [Azoarcus olearius]CAL94323.1 putative intracellular septation protein [Azoarcus olearius]
MKFFLDLLPVILFFVAYKFAGAAPDDSHALVAQFLGAGISPSQAPILIATAVAIAATLAQVLIVWLRHGKVDKMLWVSLAIITLFGGATLVFHNPTFIKWKPTVFYWTFAGALAVSALLFRRNLVQKMLEAQIRLPAPVWQRLNLAWIGFFTLMGFLNLYVAYGYSEEAWVNFKLFGAMGLMLAFFLGQGFYLSRHLEEDAK